MPLLFADNYTSTLSSGISATDVSMSVVSATGLPSMTSNDWFYATLSNSIETIWEVVKVTAVGGTTLSIVRYNGAIWAGGSNVSMRPCTKAMQDTMGNGSVERVLLSDLTIANGYSYVTCGPLETNGYVLELDGGLMGII